MEIPQVMKTFFRDAEGIPQYINVMESVQQKYKRAKLVITDDYMHAVALKLLLQSGEYKTETREWSKLQETQQNWKKWKTTFPNPRNTESDGGIYSHRRWPNG